MLYKVFIDDSGSKDYVSPYSRDFIDKPPDFDKCNWDLMNGCDVK